MPFQVESLDIANLAFPIFAGANTESCEQYWEHLQIVLSHLKPVKNLKWKPGSKVINEGIRNSFSRFFYIPWNESCIADNLTSLTLDYVLHSTIHPSHFQYLRKLSALTLNTCSTETFAQVIYVFCSAVRTNAQPLKYLDIGRMLRKDFNYLHCYAELKNMMDSGLVIQLPELRELIITNGNLHTLNDLSLVLKTSFAQLFPNLEIFGTRWKNTESTYYLSYSPYDRFWTFPPSLRELSLQYFTHHHEETRFLDLIVSAPANCKISRILLKEYVMKEQIPYFSANYSHYLITCELLESWISLGNLDTLILHFERMFNIFEPSALTLFMNKIEDITELGFGCMTPNIYTESCDIVIKLGNLRKLKRLSLCGKI